MAQSLSNILIHIIFSTKERYPFLKDPGFRDNMHKYLAGVFNGEDCPALTVGGADDHTHVLCQLSRTRSVADLIKNVKRSSSIRAKEEGGLLSKFAWQRGYGVFSIGQSQVDQVKAYIVGQEQHHRRVSFQDEFREFLRRYGLDCDERYIWD